MIPNANTTITTKKVNMARRVLLFKSHKKSVKGIRPKYKVESVHYVDLSRLCADSKKVSKTKETFG